MTAQERVAASLAAGLTIGLLGWLLWFYSSSAVTVHWPHPGQPTAYFTWRSRPPLVRDQGGKAVRLVAGKKYVLAFQPPGTYANGLLTIRTNDQVINQLAVKLNDQTFKLVADDRGGHVELPFTNQRRYDDGYHFELQASAETLVTRIDVKVVD